MGDDIAKESFGCECCWPPSAADAWEAHRTLTQVSELIDESHFHVIILACSHCTQHFVSVFTEMIDWVDGDDPQDWTMLPITDEESDEMVQQPDSVTETMLSTLGPARRCLRRDYPKASTPHIFWWKGLAVGPHD